MSKITKYPVIDETKCIDCEKCIPVCPENAIYTKPNYSCSRCMKYCISLEVTCNPKHYIINYDKCSACGACFDACPVTAISWIDSSNLLR